MRVTLNNVNYVDNNGERHVLESYTCDVADDLSTDEEIIEAVRKHIIQEMISLIKEESK